MEKDNLDTVRDILAKDERVVFAYIYGSYIQGKNFRDMDIAVYSKDGCDSSVLSVDLKIALGEHTGNSPDFFDIRIINGLLDSDDIFSLIYLRRIFDTNILLLDKNFDTRTNFIESYGMKYRECEGLIDEALI